MKIARISFAGNEEVLYDFFTDLVLQPGEYVVCDTARGPSIGRVKLVLDKSDKANKWIIQKVDYQEFKRKQAEIEDLLS